MRSYDAGVSWDTSWMGAQRGNPDSFIMHRGTWADNSAKRCGEEKAPQSNRLWGLIVTSFLGCDELREQHIHQGAAAPICATRDDIRHQFHAAARQGPGHFDRRVVPGIDGLAFPLEYFGFGVADGRDLLAFGLANQQQHPGVDLGVDLLRLRVAFGPSDLRLSV